MLLGYDQCLTPPTHGLPLIPSEVVLEAIHTAKSPVKRLALGSLAGYAVDLRVFTGITSLNYLRELRLHMNCVHYYTRLRDSNTATLRDKDVRPLLDMLLHAKNLESLILVHRSSSVKKDYQDRILKMLIDYAELHEDEFLPALQTFEFGNWVGDLTLVTRFKQLKAPRLSDIVFRGVSSTPWEDDGPVLPLKQ